MTRDEAIAAVRDASKFDTNELEDGQFVDRMAALGLLKLDEPKVDAAETRFVEVDRKLMNDLAAFDNRHRSLSEFGIAYRAADDRFVRMEAKPMSVDERVWDFLKGRYFKMNAHSNTGGATFSREAVDQIISILAVAGFKIVECRETER